MEVGSRACGSATLGAFERQCEVKGLSAGCTYSLRVRAENEVGAGDPCELETPLTIQSLTGAFLHVVMHVTESIARLKSDAKSDWPTVWLHWRNWANLAV